MLASMLAGSVFDPRRIPGLEAWWDAADSASVTLDSGRVSQWNDKSGNGRHAANTSSGSTQPDYITQGRNSLNVVRFTAASTQRLTVASSTATFKFLHDGTKSYFASVAVFGTGSDPNAAYVLFGNDAAASANVGIWVAYDDRASIPYNNAWRTTVTPGTVGSFSVLQADQNVVTPNTTSLVETLLDVGNATAASRASTRVNGGSALATNASTATPSTANAGFNFQIGAAGNNVLPMQGDICELMLFSQQPTTDAQTAIRRYLARKWGVTLS